MLLPIYNILILLVLFFPEFQNNSVFQYSYIVQYLILFAISVYRYLDVSVGIFGILVYECIRYFGMVIQNFRYSKIPIPISVYRYF